MEYYTLEKAIIMCHEIEKKLIPLGYHCALGGSCLHVGISKKDIDIIIYPHNVKEQKTPLDIINKLGLKTYTYQTQGAGLIDSITPSTTDKIVFVCENEDGARLDLFFLV